MKPGGRLILCSYGLNVNQMTVETLTALRDCDVVYSQALSDDSKRSLELMCPPIQALNGRGIEDVVKLIMSEVRIGRRVAYLTYGDPMILNACCEKLIAGCEREAVDYRVYSAISYLNEILGTLRLATHRSAGVYLSWTDAEADGFNPVVPALVFLFGTRSNERESANSLIERIQQVYPEDHEVEVLTCVYSNPNEPLRRIYRIGELRRAWEEADDKSTLFIPPVARMSAAARVQMKRSRKNNKSKYSSTNRMRS